MGGRVSTGRISIVITSTSRRICISGVLSAVERTTGMHKANVTRHARRCIAAGVGRKGTVVTLYKRSFTKFACVRS